MEEEIVMLNIGDDDYDNDNKIVTEYMQSKFYHPLLRHINHYIIITCRHVTYIIKTGQK
jgi:hypothetical protein